MKKKIDHEGFVFKKIEKKHFIGDWPFTSDFVFIGLKSNLWCIVIIDDFDYALNGITHDKFKLDFPHDAKKAIIGKTIYPFLKITQGL